MENFINSKRYISQATEARRSITREILCNYGIDYLDDKLKGIHPRELILVGAESGAGKTELVSHLAVHNAMNGKKVAFFRLEGDLHEFADIQKWKMICDMYFNQGGKTKQRINNMEYLNYRLNLIDGIEAFEDEADRILKKALKNLYLYDKSENLSKENIINKISIIHEEVDLIIIDHIHYFDMFSDANENKQLTDIMLSINQITDFMATPIIVVAHLRKKMNPKIIIPNKEDFMGSSNLFKVAHTCIMISPDYAAHDYDHYKYSTFFSIAKSRGGFPPKLIGMKVFDGIKKQYEAGYLEGIVKNGGEKVELIERKF